MRKDEFPLIDAYADSKVKEVLDKVREEIENIELLAEYTRGDIKRMALDVIDKYKSDSEGKKSEDKK